MKLNATSLRIQWFESREMTHPQKDSAPTVWKGKGLFLSLSKPQANQSGAIVAVGMTSNNSDRENSDITQALESSICELVTRFEKRFGKSSDPLSAKVIGSPQLSEKAVSIILAKGIMIDKVIPRTDSFEVQVDTRAGRLRLSKLPVTKDAQKITLLNPNHVVDPTKKIKVLIIDDSLTVQKLLCTLIAQDESFEVVGTVESDSQLKELLKSGVQPDIATLDLNLPEKNGIEILRETLNPAQIRSVVVSALSMEDGPAVLAALEEGAVDYIQKPALSELPNIKESLLDRLKAAATAHIQILPSRGSDSDQLITKSTTERVRKKFGLPGNQQAPIDISNPKRKLIAIGASTGGTEAIRRILMGLPESIPPILIVQHIPAGFSKAFADRLNASLPFAVREARDGDLVEPGLVLIAPGGYQMAVQLDQGQLKVQISDAPAVNRHKPSVDFLFDSVAQLKHWNRLGLLLTGMGADGAKGLLALRDSGSYTAAQDEFSSVVYGMPKEAVRLNAVDRVASLEAIPGLILQWDAGDLKKSNKAAA